ncbi:hypothetical protein HDU96_001357 [Phlyctochytrium bullatum]|nr:hypothetical protein HDU96_001357 [Phlyctochytrium bullatum]
MHDDRLPRTSWRRSMARKIVAAAMMAALSAAAVDALQIETQADDPALASLPAPCRSLIPTLPRRRYASHTALQACITAVPVSLYLPNATHTLLAALDFHATLPHLEKGREAADDVLRATADVGSGAASDVVDAVGRFRAAINGTASVWPRFLPSFEVLQPFALVARGPGRGEVVVGGLSVDLLAGKVSRVMAEEFWRANVAGVPDVGMLVGYAVEKINGLEPWDYTEQAFPGMSNGANFLHAVPAPPSFTFRLGHLVHSTADPAHLGVPHYRGPVTYRLRPPWGRPSSFNGTSPDAIEVSAPWMVVPPAGRGAGLRALRSVFERTPLADVPEPAAATTTTTTTTATSTAGTSTTLTATVTAATAGAMLWRRDQVGWYEALTGQMAGVIPAPEASRHNVYKVDDSTLAVLLAHPMAGREVVATAAVLAPPTTNTTGSLGNTDPAAVAADEYLSWFDRMDEAVAWWLGRPDGDKIRRLVLDTTGAEFECEHIAVLSYFFGTGSFRPLEHAFRLTKPVEELLLSAEAGAAVGTPATNASDLGLPSWMAFGTREFHPANWQSARMWESGGLLARAETVKVAGREVKMSGRFIRRDCQAVAQAALARMRRVSAGRFRPADAVLVTVAEGASRDGMRASGGCRGGCDELVRIARQQLGMRTVAYGGGQTAKARASAGTFRMASASSVFWATLDVPTLKGWSPFEPADLRETGGGRVHVSVPVVATFDPGASADAVPLGVESVAMADVTLRNVTASEWPVGVWKVAVDTPEEYVAGAPVSKVGAAAVGGDSRARKVSGGDGRRGMEGWLVLVGLALCLAASL